MDGSTYPPIKICMCMHLGQLELFLDEWKTNNQLLRKHVY